MLAYVFWHWPQSSVDSAAYVEHLVAFHQTLAAHKPTGFQRSVVFRIHGASWLDTSDDAYEEWYLLEDSAAMDRLNEAAVTGVCEEPHNKVARQAAGGTGGLYRLRAGSEDLAQTNFAVWLSKPDGVAYKDFYATLEPLTSKQNIALWGRQMTLGPTTEFCIHSTTAIQLPPGYSGLTLSVNPIFPR
jgi:hypothetical protein